MSQKNNHVGCSGSHAHKWNAMILIAHEMETCLTWKNTDISQSPVLCLTLAARHQQDTCGALRVLKTDKLDINETSVFDKVVGWQP